MRTVIGCGFVFICFVSSSALAHNDKPDASVALATQVASLRDSRVQLDTADTAALRRTIDLVRAGDTARANKRWGELVQGLTVAGAPRDVEALVHFVLREAILDTNADLRATMRRLRHQADQRKLIGQAVAEARDYLGSLDGESNEVAVVRDEIARLETLLDEAGDDAQLANVDLQNILQKQQQTLQMMSNISKMLFDTAQAIIRKIGG